MGAGTLEAVEMPSDPGPSSSTSPAQLSSCLKRGRRRSSPAAVSWGPTQEFVVEVRRPNTALLTMSTQPCPHVPSQTEYSGYVVQDAHVLITDRLRSREPPPQKPDGMLLPPQWRMPTASGAKSGGRGRGRGGRGGRGRGRRGTHGVYKLRSGPGMTPVIKAVERTVENAVTKRAPKRKRIVHRVVPTKDAPELPTGWREEVHTTRSPCATLSAQLILRAVVHLIASAAHAPWTKVATAPPCAEKRCFCCHSGSYPPLGPQIPRFSRARPRYVC